MVDLVKQGERIKAARIAAGYKQSDMALLLNMSEKNYSHIECGRHDIPLYCIDRLCVILKLSRLELIKDKVDERDAFDAMFPETEGYDSAILKCLKGLCTDTEWMYFEEICNIFEVKDTDRYFLTLPFLDFIQNVKSISKGEEGFIQVMRSLLAARKAKLNDRFIRK